ncbi:MAG TPA: hypothetical protein ENI80_03000 [Acidiferrobacteraceae bacterium]|nr:hypothetical protein [Acidiferrobacteraceae bacterium]
MLNIQISFGKAAAITVGLALLLYKLWLVEVHDLFMIGSPMDDLFFVRSAQELLAGNWLGRYTQYTLMAGPVYSMWIALCYLLAVPLHVGQQLLYAGASLVTVLALYPVVRHKGWLLLAFAYLLFNPFTYDYSSSAGAFRLGIYPALALLVIGCAIGLYTRATVPRGKPLPWAVGLGVALAAFWYTREEGIWIVPALVLTGLFVAIHGRTRGQRRWTCILGLLAVPLLIWTGSFLALGYMNWKHYGIFTDLEIKSTEFKSAYSALISVRSNKHQRYYLLEAPVSTALIKVSPAFREIKLYVGKLPASVFIWSLRDAVQAAGYYDHAGNDDRKNGPKTLDFYKRLGDEIHRACDTGQLTCDRLLSSFVPAWTEEYNREIFPTLYDVTRKLLTFDGFDPRMLAKWVSSDPYDTSWLFTYITGERLRTTDPAVLSKVPEAHREFEDMKTHRLLRIGRDYYQNLLPWLFWPSVVVILLVALVEAIKRRMSQVTVAALIVLAALVSHITIISLVAMMSTFAQRYLFASYPFVILVVILSAIMVVRVITTLRGGIDDMGNRT